MNDKPINGSDNVVPLREPSDAERTQALMAEYGQLVLQTLKGANLDTAALLATIQIQGLQLEEFMRMTFEGAPLEAGEFNKRMRLRCAAAIREIRARPKILVAKGSLQPPS